MQIGKENIVKPAFTHTSESYFSDDDCFYNFKRSFQNSMLELSAARRYVRLDTRLHSILDKLIDGMNEVQFDAVN